MSVSYTHLPPYTPDFIKLAESFGITGIRVTKAEEIQPALQAAEASKDAPVLIEFLIAWDDNCLLYTSSLRILTIARILLAA